MKSRSVSSVLPLAALSVLCACAPAKPHFGDPRIFLDSSLKLDVQSVRVQRNGSGTIDVQAVFANQSGKEEQVQYKLDWLDDYGTYSTSILSRWMPLRVSVGAPSWIQGTAPDPTISDFRLQVRRNSAEGYE